MSSPEVEPPFWFKVNRPPEGGSFSGLSPERRQRYDGLNLPVRSRARLIMDFVEVEVGYGDEKTKAPKPVNRIIEVYVAAADVIAGLVGADQTEEANYRKSVLRPSDENGPLFVFSTEDGELTPDPFEAPQAIGE